MYGNLESFNKFEESINNFHANNENIKIKPEDMKIVKIKLEDIRYSIDIKDEDVSFQDPQPYICDVILSEKRKIQFTKAEEQMLVDLVKQNECLWNVSCSNFKNVKKRNELWQQIAQHVNKPVDDVKKKWKNLRDYKKEKERKKIKGNKRPNADGEDAVLYSTDDEMSTNRLSFLDFPPTKSNTSAPLIDIPSSSTFTLYPALEFQRDDINSTMEEIEVPQPKKIRKEIIKQAAGEGGRSCTSKFQPKLKDGNAHPIRKLFDCFADSVIELPLDLQRQAKTKIMNLITGLEEIAGDRVNN